MAILKYKDPETGEVKKVGMPQVDAYGKAEVYNKTEADTKFAEKAHVLPLDGSKAMTGSLVLSGNGTTGELIESETGLIVRTVEAGGWDTRRTLQIKTKTAEPDFGKSLIYASADDGWKEYNILHTGNFANYVVNVNPNILDNWYFANPVDHRDGYIVTPGQLLYSVADLTVGADPSDGYYQVISHSGNSAYIQVNGVDRWAYFPNCIRGYTGTAYTIDRWIIPAAGALCTIKNNGLTLTGNTDTGYLRQYIQNQTSYLGKTITVTVLYADGTLTTKTGTIPEAVSGSNVTAATTPTYNYSYLAITLASNGRLYAQFRCSSGYSNTILACKLELGTQQTLAHQDANGNWVLNEIPDYNEQLLRCCMSTADSSDTYANNKVTPAAINAVNKAGDTMTGDLHAYGGANGASFYADRDCNGNKYSANLGVFPEGKPYLGMRKDNTLQSYIVFEADKLKFNSETAGIYSTVLHTGNIANYAVPSAYTWKRRKVNYSTTLGTTETVSMTTYSGGSSKTCSFSYSTSYSVDRDSNTLTLPNATNASVSHDSSASTSATSTSATLNALKGKYWKYNNTFYYTPSNAADSVVKTTSAVVGGNAQTGPIYATTQTMSIAAQPVTFSGITYGNWETVTSTSATAYPETYTYSGGYEYIKYGGADRRQTSTAIKQASYYGTGVENDVTIYVDEIPTFFMVASDGVFVLFRWGYNGYVLHNGSSIAAVKTTYNTSNKSITFKYDSGLISGNSGNPLNTANKRYWCYFFYG